MTKKKKISYDEKSYELAEHFLADHPKICDDWHKDDLAQFIQMAIEDWFTASEDQDENGDEERNDDPGNF